MSGQVFEIVDRQTGASARILASLGFNCFSWTPVLDDGRREMLWAAPGFDAGDQRPSGSGIPLLFPFPGRISGATFQFEGRSYQLEPGDAFGNAIHGFVFNRPWRIAEHNGPRIVGEFQASIDDVSILERWPSDFRIRVSYEVRARQLLSEIHYENTGSRPLPCGFATHAYFRLPISDGGAAGDTVVAAPARQVWELEQMIPTGRIRPATADESLFGELPLGDRKFDTVFTDLQRNAENQFFTRLYDPRSKRELVQSCDSSFTQCVVYTPPHREAICLEPYTCVPDAIRLAASGHKTGLQILTPGESRQTVIRLEVECRS